MWYDSDDYVMNLKYKLVFENLIAIVNQTWLDRTNIMSDALRPIFDCLFLLIWLVCPLQDAKHLSIPSSYLVPSRSRHPLSAPVSAIAGCNVCEKLQ